MKGEETGEALVPILQLQPLFGLRAQDYDELIVTAVVVALIIVPLAIAFTRSDQEKRRVTLYMGIFLFLLVLFGVIFDMVGIVFEDTSASQILTLLEDGGEMLVMSLITWFTYRLSMDDVPVPISRKREAEQALPVKSEERNK